LPTTTTPSQKNRPAPCNQEGGEAPKGACQPLPRSINKRRRLLTSRARLRATQTSVRSLRTHLLSEARPPSGASTAALTGDYDIAGSAPGHASWDANERVIEKDRAQAKSRRALPAPSCPSPVTAPHASAVVPKGLMPEAAPARIANPRGSTALAPHCGSHPECVPR
jgi:hypothetical protein